MTSDSGAVSLPASVFAKLADAPDLGLRNLRFQSIAFRFKSKRFYEGKTLVLAKSRNVANSEQKGSHSSTRTLKPTYDVPWPTRSRCSLRKEGTWEAPLKSTLEYRAWA